MGKKNLEVRPIAVNKGEIVRRILYTNPDAEFVFCAGDDKTDEDMFRALAFDHSSSSSPHAPLTMDAPVSITSMHPTTTTHGEGEGEGGEELGKRELKLSADGIFTTAVGHPSKRTLARWHVTTPGEVIEELMCLVEGSVGEGRSVEAKEEREAEGKL